MMILVSINIIDYTMMYDFHKHQYSFQVTIL